MGLTCRPIGKTKSIMRKIENELTEQKKLEKKKINKQSKDGE